MGSAQIALKRDSMRLAEAKLLELAQRFATVGGGKSSAYYRMELFDTTIPRSSVPCLQHQNGTGGSDEQQDLIIHGIQVTNILKDTDATTTTLTTTPLVMLHGYMNSGAYFYRNLLGLSSYFSTIYSLDMLGWGLSSRPAFVTDKTKNDSVDTAESFFVDSLEAWRAQKNIDKMILAGHSMGGYLSVAYCEKYPERVERLILLSPVGVPEDSLANKTRRQEMERTSSWSRKMSTRFFHYMFDNHTVGEIIRTMPQEMGLRRMGEYVEKRIPSIVEQDERDAVASYLYFNSVLPGSGEYCVNRILNSSVFAKRPQVYRIPNLQVEHISFLYGENDWMDISGGLEVQSLCEEKLRHGQTAPHVKVYKVRNAGHLLMLDNWQEINAGVILSAGWMKEALGPDYPVPIEVSAVPGVAIEHPGPLVPSNEAPEVAPVI